MDTRHCRTRAFTLVEVLVATALSGLVLAGVLSAFLAINRTSFRAGNYSEMEAQTRHALDLFGQDARRANNIAWNDHRSITLTLPTATNATTQVTYAYDHATGTPTAGCFYRKAGNAASAAAPEILVRQVGADFTFRRYKLDQPDVAENSALNDLETKLIEVAFRSARTGRTAAATTQAAFSARHILRNKRVSN